METTQNPHLTKLLPRPPLLPTANPDGKIITSLRLTKNLIPLRRTKNLIPLPIPRSLLPQPSPGQHLTWLTVHRFPRLYLPILKRRRQLTASTCLTVVRLSSPTAVFALTSPSRPITTSLPDLPTWRSVSYGRSLIAGCRRR